MTTTTRGSRRRAMKAGRPAPAPVPVERRATRPAPEAGPDAAQQVDLAYRLVAGRAPKPKELRQSIEFLKTQSRQEFALAMLNLNAFLYVN